MIATHNLAVGYGTTPLLSGLNLRLTPGEVTALLGANGRGKSTLMRTIAALQRPLAGSVSIDGSDVASLSTSQLARLVSIVTGTDAGAGAFTVAELVAMGRHPYTGFFGRLGTDDREIVAEAMRRTGVDHLAHRHVATLSDGERRRALVAKALAQQTPVIILDEPTAWLDVANRIELLHLMGRLATEEGKTVLVSSHDIAPTLAVAQRLWLITDRGLEQGDTQALISDGAMDRIFPGRNLRFDSRLMDYLPL